MVSGGWLECLYDLKECLEYLCVKVIGCLLESVVVVFLESEEVIFNGEFDEELFVQLLVFVFLQVVLKLVKDMIYMVCLVLEIEIVGFEVFGVLFGLFINVVEVGVGYICLIFCECMLFKLLLIQFFGYDGEFLFDFYNCLLQVVDFVVGMIDFYVVDMYCKLKGFVLLS